MSVSRWTQFSRTEQLAAVGAELMRAAVWENKDKDKFLLAIERSMELISNMLDEKKWKGRYFILLFLRQEIGKFYVGQAHDIQKMYNAF